MKKSSFSGFGAVFKYTFTNEVKAKKYLISTIIFAIVLIVGITTGLYFAEKSFLEADPEFVIDKVYVANETDFLTPAYDRFAKLSEDDYVSSITFEKVDSDVNSFVENMEDEFILVVQSQNEDGFYLNIIVSDENDASEKEIDTLGASLSNYFKLYLCTMNGLSDQDMMQIVIPVISNVSELGEPEEDEYKLIFSIILNFVILITVYMIVLLYGQKICTDVTLEKSSKLTEQLLMCVSPNALLFGKILANISASLLQFLIWIASVFVGLLGGDKIVSALLDTDESIVSTLLSYVSEWFKGAGFSAVQILLSILMILFGFIFYLSLAGLSGSLVTKPEEAANMQTLYIFPLLISYFVLIYEMTSNLGQVNTVFMLIPFTGVLCAPGAILMGQIPVYIGIISIIITLIFVFIFLFIAARVYKGLLFFNDKKLTLKDVIAVIKIMQ